MNQRLDIGQRIKINKVLVLSPHTDDAEIGAGGTIARFVEEGKDINFAIFSMCETTVPKGWPKDTLKRECIDSLKIFGVLPERIHLMNYNVRTFPEHRQEILDDMIMIKNHLAPELVLVPSSHDMHQDHGVIYWEALRAFKKDSSIWGYEHPWNNLNFTTDVFVTLNAKHVEMKIKALHVYKSQSNRGYMKEENLRALLITHGAQIDFPFAEAFELVRLIY
jgi:LmbE family N-acetylglucosaminyl deacetylase